MDLGLNLSGDTGGGALTGTADYVHKLSDSLGLFGQGWVSKNFGNRGNDIEFGGLGGLRIKF